MLSLLLAVAFNVYATSLTVISPLKIFLNHLSCVNSLDDSLANKASKSSMCNPDKASCLITLIISWPSSVINAYTLGAKNTALCIVC
jgi:hypothetical protein